MAELEREQKEHLGLRALFMVVFWLVLRLGYTLTGLLALVQWIMAWFTDDNRRLRRFCRSLARFQAQILDYLLFNSEQKPFPFDDWPDGSDPAEET